MDKPQSSSLGKRKAIGVFIFVLSSIEKNKIYAREYFSKKYSSKTEFAYDLPMVVFVSFRPAFLKLWSADHKWSSGSALVVLLD